MRLFSRRRFKHTNKGIKLVNYIVYILAFSILIGLMQPIAVHGAACSSYDSCSFRKEFYENQKGGAVDPAFKELEGQLPANTPGRNKDNLPFNYRLWHDKGIVVYGSYKSVPSNDFKGATQYYENGKRIVKDRQGYYSKDSKKGEYRFHGYDINGNKFTNINFPDDVNKGEKLSDKTWLYHPWYNELTPSRTRPAEMGKYNQAAIVRRDPYTQAWINATLAGWNIRNNRGTDGEVGTAPSNEAYNYVYVMSPPTTTFGGEGRLWHRENYKGAVTLYQTFSIPKVKKTPNPSNVEVSVLTPLDKRKFDESAGGSVDNEKIKVDIRLTITLDDEDAYGDAVKKVRYYTRDDVKTWDINFKSAVCTDFKQVKLTKDSKRKNVWYADYALTYTVKQIKGLKANGYKDSMNANVQAKYIDDVKSLPGSATGFVEFIGIMPPPAPPPPPPDIEEPGPGEPPHNYVDPNPNIVHPWFDIVPYPASDNTDMSAVASRKVYINGEQVDDDLFFSGEYVFGDGNEGLKRIDVYYVSTDGYPAEVTRWIYVYPTKPRAQFLFLGTYKQNRKMTLTETSNSANDEFVLEHYPICEYEWAFRTIEGDSSSRKMRDISQVYKELMYKTPGIYEVELVVTNTLGRRSDPYTLTFEIFEDYPAAVICNLNYNVLARRETINAYAYEAVSTDGDMIASNKVEVYYDSNNDGECEQLIATFNNITDFPEFTPAKLGNYKFVNTVKEEFGQDTLLEFITDADKKVKVIEREFFVDNLMPMTGLYVDIPIVRPEIDLYVMLDKNLQSSKTQWVLNNRINLDNSMRAYNILPKVETWDMHTYTYSQSASTTRNTGTSYPSSTTYYSSNGYSGTLSLTSASDNGSYQDKGHYEYKTESRTFTATHNNTVTNTFSCPNGTLSDTSDSSKAPENKYINSDGYSGSIPRTNTNQNSESNSYCSICPNGHITRKVRNYTAYYSGTLTKIVEIWIPNWVWVSNYTGFYSGTIYKDIRQPYTDPFRPTAHKYVVYISDNNVSELSDLQMVMSKADGKLILAGQAGIKSQIAHEHFILNNKGIDQLMDDVISYISENNAAIEKYYVLAGEDTFTMQTSDYDEENDPLVEKKVQYVQEQNYFDNPTGMETFATDSFKESSNWVDSLVNKFNKVGKFSIYRRVKDQPSTDPRFAEFSRYSGIPELQIYSHRRPIAQATLDWDYDAAKNLYKTTWVCSSYDLDHLTRRPDKGIVERKIMFRKSGGEWLYYIPSELDAGTYELNYYVKDPEGVWSHPFMMNFTLQDAPPIQFDAKLRTLDNTFNLGSIPASEYLQAYDIWTRYPFNVKLEMALYKGISMVSPLQTTNYSTSTGKKAGNDIFWSNVSYRIPETLKDDTYTFKISAVDVNNSIARQEKNFTVTVRTPINLVPSMPKMIITESPVDILASTAKYANTNQVTLYVGTVHQTTLPMNATTIGRTKTWKVTHDVPANIPDGMYIASFTAKTPNGNSETATANYEVQGLRITDVTIEGCWNHWRGQTNLFGKRMSVEPHRFLSLERVKINVNTTGYADKVEIRFSPELEAMRFKDKYGNIYDYKNDFKLNYVYFPKTITLDSTKKENHVYWEYIFPLASSTKSWEDVRARGPYIMEVTAWKGTKSVKYTISDIDITGNIYDLTYIQPVN